MRLRFGAMSVVTTWCRKDLVIVAFEYEGLRDDKGMGGLHALRCFPFGMRLVGDEGGDLGCLDVSSAEVTLWQRAVSAGMVLRV